MRFLSGGNDLSICHGNKLWDIKGFLMHKYPILCLTFFYDLNMEKIIGVLRKPVSPEKMSINKVLEVNKRSNNMQIRQKKKVEKRKKL